MASKVMETKLTSLPGEPHKPITPGSVGESLFPCACEALVLAILVQIAGNVILGVVGGLWHQMTPSLPPIVAEEPVRGASSPWLFRLFHQHQLAFIFGVLFVGKVATRLASKAQTEKQRKAAAWVGGLFARITDGWFSLIVVNAFIAAATVFALGIARQFSLTHFVWQAVGNTCNEIVRAIAGVLPGEGGWAFLKSWVGWYHANEPKFLFWVLYIGAICDDLGLPNYKTWSSRVWRRCFRRSARNQSSTLNTRST